MAESSIPVLPSFIKKCCRVCGRSVDERSRRTLFSTAGLRDKLSERLSTVTGIPIGRDELSEFVCRKCAAELDKYSRKAAEAENFKRGLIDKLSQTTLRHRSILQWSRKKAQSHCTFLPESPASRLHHKRTKPAGSPRTPASAYDSASS